MRSFYAEGAPPMLRLAALVQGLEAVALFAAAVAQAVEALSGQSYQQSSGVALAVFEALIAVGLAWIARAVAQLRPWSRTPAVMTQLCCGVVGVILWQSHRIAFGAPVLVLAIVGLVAFLSPASRKALRRPFPDDPKAASAKPSPPAKGTSAKAGSPKAGGAKTNGAKSGGSKGSGAKAGGAKR